MMAHQGSQGRTGSKGNEVTLDLQVYQAWSDPLDHRALRETEEKEALQDLSVLLQQGPIS